MASNHRKEEVTIIDEIFRNSLDPMMSEHGFTRRARSLIFSRTNKKIPHGVVQKLIFRLAFSRGVPFLEPIVEFYSRELSDYLNNLIEESKVVSEVELEYWRYITSVPQYCIFTNRLGGFSAYSAYAREAAEFSFFRTPKLDEEIYITEFCKTILERWTLPFFEQYRSLNDIIEPEWLGRYCRNSRCSYLSSICGAAALLLLGKTDEAIDYCNRTFERIKSMDHNLTFIFMCKDVSNNCCYYAAIRAIIEEGRRRR